jgi:hypothetical protein
MADYVGPLVDLAPQLKPILQQGLLERELQEGLDTVFGYQALAIDEYVPAGVGETITKTRKGRKAPPAAALNPQSINGGIDNGMSSSTYAVEQYTLTMTSYGDTVDTNWIQSGALIADMLLANARNNGVQAATTMERLAKSALFAAYNGGNTFVRTDIGASTTTTCHVDNVNGFQYVLVNGVPTPVTVTTAPLTVVETTGRSAAGVAQTLTVTNVAVDVTNKSSTPGGASGVLTFAAATAPVNGDELQASNGPAIIRPRGQLSTASLIASDLLTVQTLLDMRLQLENNGIPPMDDGTFALIIAPSSHRQLFADQDFKIWYQGREQSSVFNDGYILKMLGLTFVITTEAPVQPTSAAQGTGNTGDATIAVQVQRPLMIGSEALIKGNFEMLKRYQAAAVAQLSKVSVINDVVHVIRPPIDRLGQNISMSWFWAGGFTVPTDATATTSTIPTASNALYKRAVVCEHAG